MAKNRTYYYLIDKLNFGNGEQMKRALRPIREIAGIGLNPREGILEVTASKDVAAEVKMACEIVGTVYRMKLKESPHS